MNLRKTVMLIVVMITITGCSNSIHNVIEVDDGVSQNEVSNSTLNVIIENDEQYNESIASGKNTFEVENTDNELEDDVNKLNEYLVASTLDGTTILINITKALNGETSILEASQIKSKYLSGEKLENYNFRKISADGKYVFLTHKNGMLNLTESDENKKIIYNLLENSSYEFEVSANVMSDDLSLFYKNRNEIYDVTTDSILSLKNWNGAWPTQIVSNDNKYIVGAGYEGDNCFLMIFDIENDVIFDKVFLGESNPEEFRIPTWVSQWHSYGKIFFNFEHYAYMYDFKTKELNNIGKYMFYPFLTNDEENIVYARLQSDPSEWPVSHLSDYGDVGVYVRNIETGMDTQILKDIDFGTRDMRFDYLITTEIIYEDF